MIYPLSSGGLACGRVSHGTEFKIEGIKLVTINDSFSQDATVANALWQSKFMSPLLNGYLSSSLFPKQWYSPLMVN